MKTDNFNNKFYIREISSQETFKVRHPVLRQGRPIEDCAFEGDELETTIHLGLYINEQLISVATFLSNKNDIFPEIRQYQLRGMAVLKSYQGQQLGQYILKHGEQLLTEKRVVRVWLNAREHAVNFYKNNHYQIVGQPFEINKVGMHYVMTKRL